MMLNKESMTHCIACTHPEKRPIYRDLSKCLQCGYICAEIYIDELTASNIYNHQNYFDGGLHGSDYVDYLQEERALKKNFRSRLKNIIHHCKHPQQMNLLEIGSAYGFFLEVAKPFFKKISGVDISREACSWAKKNLNVDTEWVNFLDDNFQVTSQNIICMWDTIEHLVHPHLYIKKIHRTLKSKGYLHITTGNIESFNAKVRGSRWRMIHPPTHIHYFSPRSITRLLNRYGFDVVQIKTVGNWRSFNAYAKALLASKVNKQFFYGGRLTKALLSTPLYLNLYDIMHVVARKRS